MKIQIKRTSDWEYKEIKEYDSLEQCIDEILSDPDLFRVFDAEVVVSKPDDRIYPAPDFSYVVEIYDTYRE